MKVAAVVAGAASAGFCAATIFTTAAVLGVVSRVDAGVSAFGESFTAGALAVAAKFTGAAFDAALSAVSGVVFDVFTAVFLATGAVSGGADTLAVVTDSKLGVASVVTAAAVLGVAGAVDFLAVTFNDRVWRRIGVLFAGVLFIGVWWVSVVFTGVWRIGVLFAGVLFAGVLFTRCWVSWSWGLSVRSGCGRGVWILDGIFVVADVPSTVLMVV